MNYVYDSQAEWSCKQNAINMYSSAVLTDWIQYVLEKLPKGHQMLHGIMFEAWVNFLQTRCVTMFSHQEWPRAGR